MYVWLDAVCWHPYVSLSCGRIPLLPSLLYTKVYAFPKQPKPFGFVVHWGWETAPPLCPVEPGHQATLPQGVEDSDTTLGLQRCTCTSYRTTVDRWAILTSWNTNKTYTFDALSTALKQLSKLVAPAGRYLNSLKLCKEFFVNCTQPVSQPPHWLLLFTSCLSLATPAGAHNSV